MSFFIAKNMFHECGLVASQHNHNKFATTIRSKRLQVAQSLSLYSYLAEHKSMLIGTGCLQTTNDVAIRELMVSCFGCG
jgi:hypothetical protein